MQKWFNLIQKIFPSEVKIWIFDNENNKSLVFHEFSLKDREEIDGILVYKNMIFLINGFSGDGRSEFDEKHKFFLRFRNIHSIDQLNLKIEGRDKTENELRVREFKEYLNNNPTLKFFLKKIVFAPHIKAENMPLWSNVREDEFLIDKPLFKYLHYCCSEVNEEYALRELFIMLNIGYNQIDRKLTDTSLGDPKTDSGHAAIYSDIEQDKIVMYSFIVPVKDIIKYIKILRFEAVPENKKAFQRIVDKERLDVISDNYLNNNQSFPNNIILAFNPEVYTTESKKRAIQHLDNNANSLKLYLLEEYGSLIVIDGQHRILSHLKKEDRDINKKILVSILDFKGDKDAHRAMSEIFVQVNNQHRKISPMVMLRIEALNRPDAPQSRWYLIFKDLNKKSAKTYFSDIIEFEDAPLRRFESDDKERISISSIIKYAGINGLEKGNRKYKGLLDESLFRKEQLKDLIKNYFEIIQDLIKGSQTREKIVLSPRDIGGLIRLMIHFANDRRTREIFLNLGEIQNKAVIKQYLNKIDFDQLKNLHYQTSAWALMEGYFLGKIRKNYKRFGVATGRLKMKAIKEMHRAMKR